MLYHPWRARAVEESKTGSPSAQDYTQTEPKQAVKQGHFRLP